MKVTYKKIFVVVGSLFCLGIANSASFDCGKASTYAEKAICSNVILSDMDDELAVVFAKARDHEGDSEDFKKIARSNLNTRNACKDEICLHRWLKNSITMYQEMVPAEPVTTTAQAQAPQTGAVFVGASASQAGASQPAPAETTASHASPPPQGGGPALTGNKAVDSVILGDPDPSIEPTGVLAEMFRYDSKYTELQRNKKLSEIKDKIVIWRLPVYEVRETKKNVYRIQFSRDLDELFDDIFNETKKPDIVTCFANITPRNERDVDLIYSLKTGDMLTIKGRLTGKTTMRSLNIDPAVIWN